MRTRSLLASSAAVALGLGLIVVGVANCGPSAYELEYEEYRAGVLTQLTAEKAKFSRMVALSQEVDERVEPYRRFLSEDASVFYLQFEHEVKGLAPKDAQLAVVHEHLVAFARERLAFVESELARIPVIRESNRSAEVAGIDAASDRAEDERIDYARLTREAPNIAIDPRYTTLVKLADNFHVHYQRPLERGDLDVEAVRQRLKAHVIPRLQELRHDRKFKDNKWEQQLRRAVVAAEEFYTLLAEALPLLVRRKTAFDRTERAMKEADAHLETFKARLREARRD